MRFELSASVVMAALLTAGVAHAAKTPKSVMVKMETSDGRDGGAALLVDDGNSLKITVQFQNLDPGMHGIHFHQYPKCDAPSFASAGGYFNPSGKEHSGNNAKGNHAGDIDVNLKVGDSGKVRRSFTVEGLTLKPGAPNSVFANGGTSLIVHQGPDDQKNDPSGNGGGREACGIVSIQHASDTVLRLSQKSEEIPPSNH